MAVFRINKTRDYTVMSNYHLKDTGLTLKSKGLLSMMLSLPEEWNYTTRGLAAICKEGVDCIGTALKELERTGYIKRNRIRNDKGKIVDTEYVIFEKPQEKPDMEQPYTENPYMDKPHTETPGTENPAQLNTNISNTKTSSTNVSNTYPIKSYQKEEPPAQCGGDKIGYDEMSAYRDLIKENIEYSILSVKLKQDIPMLDEIVDLLTETVCTKKDSLIIAGDVYPTAVVKSKLLKLDAGHIEYVIDCMKSNTTEVRNIKKYLLAALFNAPSTMDSYYTARVNHDLYGHE
ncbi:MAG TPA: helix-turn-helix domain-containing protein [Clostridiales bacterium]|nr:helix-turn-helix domain-containing protein [Clostridiales bacterium]